MALVLEVGEDGALTKVEPFVVYDGTFFCKIRTAEDRIAKTAALLLLYTFRNLWKWASY